MPGFGEIKAFTADDGERVSLVSFASPEEHAAWRRIPSIVRDSAVAGANSMTNT
jgi:hypothetical protein